MFHVYAITDSAPSLEASGLDGAELCTIGGLGLFAVVSEHVGRSAQPSEDDLWAHERVVEELMQRATVLPMRFDATVADEAAVARLLAERRSEFEALLGAVRGAVELGLRARLAEEHEEDEGVGDEAGGEAGPGTVYLLARARQQRRVTDAAARIHEPLAALSRQSRQSRTALSPELFKAAYLVDRGKVDAFRARVDVLDSELGPGRIICTGPWPPYSFSSEERS